MEVFFSLGFFSYLASGVAYLFVLVVYLIAIRKSRFNLSFLLLLATTIVWSVLLTLSQVGESISFKFITVTELARYFTWLYVLQSAAGYYLENNSKFDLKNPLSPISTGLIFVLSLFAVAFNDQWVRLFDIQVPIVLQISWMLGFSILGLLLVEQVIRNAPDDDRSSVKLLCLSAASIFAYDFFVYSNALLIQKIDYEFWAARGFVNIIAIPTLLLAAVRNPRMAPEIQISRKFVLHSTTLFATGLYLLLMSIAGFYIKGASAEWGKLAQVAFLFAACLLLAVLFFSPNIKTRIKRYLSYSFQNKYDYRDEWDRFSRTLLTSDSSMSIHQRSIQATGQIVDSKGGTLWIKDEQSFRYKASWKTDPISTEAEKADSVISQSISRHNEMLVIDELRSQVKESGIDHWMVSNDRSWIVLPLRIGDNLFGFIHLEKPTVEHQLDIADRDLLNTIAHHVALALFLNEADNQLQQAQRFKDLNQMTAFLVHDLKTVFSQLTLLVDNAQTHKNNPEFIDDMITTVDHTTQKMGRLLEQLRNPEASAEMGRVNLNSMLTSLVSEYSRHAVKVSLQVEGADKAIVDADEEQLASAIKHLLQNAVESIDKTGEVALKLFLLEDDSKVCLTIEDNGKGMTPEFIAEELFKPFSSTKGVSGMGVGVYQSREYIRSIKGEIEVTSQPDKGTIFNITLPCDYEQ